MDNKWTPEQEALLARIWPTGESLKKYMAELGDRPYSTIVSHAHKVLKLGSRPVSARGRAAYAWPTIEAELKEGPGSASELVKRTGLSMAPVFEHLRKANPGPNGKVHIIVWRKRSEGGDPVAVYAIGPGENAPKPAPFTTAEKWQRKIASRPVAANPFAVAAGFVTAPVITSIPTGRIYQQSMSIKDDEMETA
ncbi:hypothetical protein [Paraburkholderia sp.]|uniref:hypothetical protein n=1 Tax=Paraburkholderia sp. TaxID=1926495 RepID=UPI003C7A03BF